MIFKRFYPLPFTAGFILFLIAQLYNYNGLTAQPITPVHCSFSVDQKNASTANLIITCKLDDQWHIFSLSHKGEVGLPTVISFQNSKDYQLDGEVIEPRAMEEMDPLTNTMLRYFKKEVVFTQKIKIVSNKPFKLNGVLTYQACNDEGCIAPIDVDLIFDINKDSK